jgi:hypothetical protein
MKNIRVTVGIDARKIAHNTSIHFCVYFIYVNYGNKYDRFTGPCASFQDDTVSINNTELDLKKKTERSYLNYFYRR